MPDDLIGFATCSQGLKTPAAAPGKAKNREASQIWLDNRCFTNLVLRGTRLKAFKMEMGLAVRASLKAFKHYVEMAK
jgi:hypothetical protein